MSTAHKTSALVAATAAAEAKAKAKNKAAAKHGATTWEEAKAEAQKAAEAGALREDEAGALRIDEACGLRVDDAGTCQEPEATCKSDQTAASSKNQPGLDKLLGLEPEADVVDLGKIENLDDLAKALNVHPADSNCRKKTKRVLRIERPKRPSSARIPTDSTNLEERESLDKLLWDAAAKARTSENPAVPTKSENYFYLEHMEELMSIAGKIGSITALVGPGGVYGFEQPMRTLTRKVRQDELDEMPADDYEAICECAEKMSPLWEGQDTMQGIQLARNLLLQTILSDDWLRDQALAKANSWLAQRIYTMKRHRYWFS